MKTAIIEKVFDLPFDEVYNSIRKNVLSDGFLLLHEIDTKTIVAKHGVQISSLKQLLFFHPTYIKLILSQDHLAINEIPIKIVIYELKNNGVSVSVPNLGVNLRDYGLGKMGDELNERIKDVLEI